MSTNGAGRVLVIIPAYNEEPTVARVIAGARQHAPQADVVVVDDGSTDRTAEVARAAGATVISHPINLGDGAARQTGFKYAFRRGYERVVQLDGDGQHDPACIPDLLAALRPGVADVVIGSRFLEDKGYKAQPVRRVGMILFSAIASLVTGQRITDPTSGYRAMTREVVSLYVTDAYPQHYPDADVLITSHFAGFRIIEVPVRMFQNVTGKSIHSGWRPAYYVFKMLLSIFVNLLRKRPRRREDGRWNLG